MYLHILLYHIVDLDVSHSCATNKHDPNIVIVLHSCTCSQGAQMFEGFIHFHLAIGHCAQRQLLSSEFLI